MVMDKKVKIEKKTTDGIVVLKMSWAKNKKIAQPMVCN